MRLTLGDGTTIDIEPGRVLCSVRYRHDTISRHGWVETSDVAAWARDLLRSIDGPSIDDVREVWESPRATSVHDTDHGLSAQPWHVRVPHPEGGSMIFGGATEREALQAAYDAGVARAKAATVPPS